MGPGGAMGEQHAGHVEGAAPADIAVRDRPCRASIKSAQQSEHRLGARMGYGHARQERRKEHRQLSIARSERPFDRIARRPETARLDQHGDERSEEHTSELQSLLRISYAAFCLKKKQKHNNTRE